MTITLNGETRQFDPDLNLAQLVDRLGHTGHRIAIERNGEIVPKRLHGETLLLAGDRLEIVVAVGGG
ncbi:sulfur carrier protein ThiS [Chitinimonas viridis]|uniref:Sulfur carrier protein ThiS n=1 Tax=Chitinimonas viridis TaxID=664880 RepID=A0ABT8B0K5_9NEIS|nr:sulfur carrier protein ThiS [Chitinimonas viridis]